ncbi:hypothetical protein HDU84_002477 [Entophlyctis sp. JEL0112]|nr:hypothetical protein HDU84_002477 [Entophlyctis sp. JEL0112]
MMGRTRARNEIVFPELPRRNPMVFQAVVPAISPWIKAEGFGRKGMAPAAGEIREDAAASTASRKPGRSFKVWAPHLLGVDWKMMTMHIDRPTTLKRPTSQSAAAAIASSSAAYGAQKSRVVTSRSRTMRQVTAARPVADLVHVATVQQSEPDRQEQQAVTNITEGIQPASQSRRELLTAAALCCVHYINSKTAESALSASPTAHPPTPAVSIDLTHIFSLQGLAPILATVRMDANAGATAFTNMVFAKAAERYIQQTELLPAQALCDFSATCLPLICAAIQNQLTSVIEEVQAGEEPLVDWTPANKDLLFLSVVALFVGALHAVVASEDAPAAQKHKIFKKEDEYIRSLVSKFLVDRAALTGNDNGTSLFSWLQIVSNGSDDEFVDITRNAKLAAQRDLKFWSDYLADLKGRTNSFCPPDLKQGMKYDMDRNRKEISAVEKRINAMKVVFPSVKMMDMPETSWLVFLPAQKEEFYIEIMKLCMRHDLKTVDESGRKGVSDLSAKSIELLDECAFRWRLTRTWRKIAYMSGLISLFAESFFEIEYIEKNIFQQMEQLTVMEYVTEESLYISNLSTLSTYMTLSIDRFSELQVFDRDTANTRMQIYIEILRRLNQDVIWKQHPDSISDVVAFVQSRLTNALVDRFGYFAQRCKADTLPGLVTLTREISRDLDLIHASFFSPICDSFLLGPLAESIYVHENYTTFLFRTLQNSSKEDMNLLLGSDGLYNEVSELFGKLDQKKYDIEEIFRPYVEIWLDETKDRWSEWAINAIKSDMFTPIMAPTTMYSSSVRDIFGFFNTGLKFVKKLKDGAANEGRKKALTIKFLRLMGKSIETLTDETYREFENFSKTASDNEKPPTFTPRQCIKLNNMVGALRLLSSVFHELDEDFGNYAIDPNAKRSDDIPGQFKLNITVVRAYNLPARDGHSADPYVYVMMDRTQIGVTHIVQRTLNPVWNSNWTFGGVNDPNLSFYFLVCEIDNLGAAVQIGRSMATSFAERKFTDYLTHTFPVRLEPQGELIVRVRRLGEIEDSIFWVVRYAELVWTKCAASFKASILGFGSAPAIEEAKVEKALMPLLQYLDENLIVLNENLDRPFLDSLLSGPFFLGLVKNSGSVGSPDIQTTMDMDRPSLLALVIWNEMVVRMQSSVVTMRKENDKRQLEALVIILEYLKSFFYCEVAGRCCGFPTDVLENDKYRRVRATMREVIPESKLFQ